MSRILFALLWLIAAVILVVSFAWAIVRMLSETSKVLALPTFTVAASAAWSFLLFCLAIAGLTMAFIQICRILIPFRGRFHRQALRSWLKNSIEHDDASREKWNQVLKNARVSEPIADAAMAEFESSNPWEPSRGPMWFKRSMIDVPLIYDLSLEQLCGQLTLAAESALDRPMRFRHLLISLAGTEGARDLFSLFSSSLQEKRAERGPSSQSQEGESEQKGSANERLLIEEGQARGALTRIIQRRIDAFQIETGGNWRRTLQGFAVGVSIFFSWSITIARIPHAADTATKLGYLLYAGLAGVLAAFLSMFLRDLTALIELRRRQS